MTEPKLYVVYQVAIIIGLILAGLFLYQYMGTAAESDLNAYLQKYKTHLIVLVGGGLVYYLTRVKKK